MERNKAKEQAHYKIWIPLLFSIASIIGLIGGYKMAGNSAFKNLVVKEQDEKSARTGRVEELVRFIESRYVTDLDSEELIEDAFQNVLDHLDPHSLYLKPEEMQQLNDQMGGSFEGIGIESILIDDTLYVNHVLPKGPAAEAGLRKGDRILAINDTIIAGRNKSFVEMRDLLKGALNQKLKLEIKAHEDQKPKNIEVEIGYVDVKSVLGFRYDDYAVVRIDRFSADSYREFMDCLKTLDDEGGFKNLILDLRGNPGGFLPEAVKMLNQIFKEKGRLLVYTQGRKGRVSDYESTGKNFYDIDKVAILVDEGSASGSEIIAGAIQDWDRGLIVGRRTFGKGLVQEQYGLENGGALRLTVAEYFTPSGRLIQKSFEDKSTYRDDISDRIISGELTGNLDMPILDSTLYRTKIEKRNVYGGGGISPDIYIPLDSVELSAEAVQIVSNAEQFVFQRFIAGEIVVPNAKEDVLNADYPSQSLVSRFLAEQSLNVDEKPWLNDIASKHLKKEIARLFFGKQVALEVEMQNDPFLVESVQALSRKDIFAELK